MATATVPGGSGASGASVSTPAPASNDTVAPDPTQETAQAEAPEQATAHSVTPDATDTEEQLLSEEEYEAVQDDPVALKKALQTAFTKKTQALSPAKRLLQALSSDPDKVILELAKARGLKVEAPPATPAAGATQDTRDEIMDALSEHLGPTAAAQLKPALEKLVEKFVGPLREAHEVSLAKAALEQANQVKAEFTRSHPGWEKFEPAMVELAKKVQPNGMNPAEYMDMLYTVVSGESAIAKQVNKVVQRMTKSAAAVSEARVSGATPAQVKKSLPDGRLPTLKEAAEAALRGERFE